MTDGGGRSPRLPSPPSDYQADSDLRALYEAHGSALLGYLMRLTNGDRHRAEDLLQETLIRAWRHPEARRDGEWSLSWLYMVARRIAIDHVRAAMARPTEVSDDGLPERGRTSSDFDRIGERAEILEVLRELPAIYREVLVEIYFRDQSVAQAAETLGLPKGTVKSRTFYGLQELRQRFSERGPS